MGFAKLNVWVHDVVNACRISNSTWFVNVTDCSGRIVEWCGRRFAGIQAPCGHVEFKIPPGCYIVSAAMSVAIRPPFVYANYITHFAIVMVRCDEEGCVHLYAPTYKRCWRFILMATRILAHHEGIPRERAERLVDALNDVIQHVPTTAQDAELDQLFEELPKQMEQEPTEAKDPGEPSD